MMDVLREANEMVEPGRRESSGSDILNDLCLLSAFLGVVDVMFVKPGETLYLLVSKASSEHFGKPQCIKQSDRCLECFHQ